MFLTMCTLAFVLALVVCISICINVWVSRVCMLLSRLRSLLLFCLQYLLPSYLYSLLLLCLCGDVEGGYKNDDKGWDVRGGGEFEYRGCGDNYAAC